MDIRAFSYSWALIKKGGHLINAYICRIPLRSPMSIFSKSPDLEKCANEVEV